MSHRPSATISDKPPRADGVVRFGAPSQGAAAPHYARALTVSTLRLPAGLVSNVRDEHTHCARWGSASLFPRDRTVRGITSASHCWLTVSDSGRETVIFISAASCLQSVRHGRTLELGLGAFVRLPRGDCAEDPFHQVAIDVSQLGYYVPRIC